MTPELVHLKYIWLGIRLHKHNCGEFVLFVKVQNPTKFFVTWTCVTLIVIILVAIIQKHTSAKSWWNWLII